MTPEERAAALENDILAYIRHLRAAEKLSLTVHLMQFNPYRHMDFGNLYTVHPNPLCVYLKSDVRLMDHCIERQTKVVERAARGHYCGMCWAGVTEYVYPIRDPEGRIAAFISVSGYGVERERALPRLIRACRAHGLDEARSRFSISSSRATCPTRQGSIPSSCRFRTCAPCSSTTPQERAARSRA